MPAAIGNALHSLGLPWAWSIVGLTIIVRMLLVPLTVKQIHSMQNMQAHAPQMKEIQRKYKGDRTKLNEELMKFYKENNINPASSCLPLVAQIPVFIVQADTVDDRVRHADRLDAEGAGLDTLARSYGPEVRRLGEPVLAQPLRDQRQRQGGAVHGHHRLAEEIRQGADVILVAVGQDNGVEPRAPGERVRKVRNDVVDPGQLVIGEHEAAVDRNQVLAGLDEHHIEADFPQATEGDQADDRLHGNSFPDGGLILPPPSHSPKFQDPWVVVGLGPDSRAESPCPSPGCAGTILF